MRHIEKVTYQQTKGYMIVAEHEEQQMLEDIKGKFNVYPIFRTPYRSCDSRRQVACYYFWGAK